MRATLLSLLATLLIASAQQTATRPPAPQKKNAPAKQDSASKKVPTFKGEAQLVIVDVFAKDKDGNPVPNLKASDFAITEDGKAQNIRICEYQELHSEPAPPVAEAAPALTQRPEASAPKPAAPVPQVAAVTANQIAPAKARRSEVQGPPPDGDVLRHDLHADSGPDARPERRA